MPPHFLRTYNHKPPHFRRTSVYYTLEVRRRVLRLIFRTFRTSPHL